MVMKTVTLLYRTIDSKPMDDLREIGKWIGRME